MRLQSRREAKSPVLPHAKGQNLALAEQELCRRVTCNGPQHRYRRPPLKGGRFAPFDHNHGEDVPPHSAGPIADGLDCPRVAIKRGCHSMRTQRR